MSETGLAAVLLMIGMVMLVMCFWKQIAIFLLFAVVTVFCFGVYYIVSTIADQLSLNKLPANNSSEKLAQSRVNTYPPLSPRS